MKLIGAALRSAGEVKLPALTNLIGAAVLVPLSPLLILGWEPLPALGVAGAGVATLIFYAGALFALFVWLLRGNGPLALTRRPLDASLFAAILRIRLTSAIGTLLTSLTIVAITGSVGQYGPQTGWR